MDKYEEALERAKEWEREHPNGYVIRDMMEFIFPGYNDSEDEMIRKELIQYLRDYPYLPNGQHTKADFFVYLEKQKEHKPIFKKGDRVIWDGEEFNILDVDKDTYNVGGYIVPFSREGELHPIGQKPAEWSEEDEQAAKEIRAMFNRGTFLCPDIQFLSNWLVSIKDRITRSF